MQVPQTQLRLLEASGDRVDELNGLVNVLCLEKEYHKASHSMGGATAYRFRKWRDREEIKPIPEKFRPAWKSAQVEANVWNSNEATAGRVNITILICVPPTWRAKTVLWVGSGKQWI